MRLRADRKAEGKNRCGPRTFRERILVEEDDGGPGRDAPRDAAWDRRPAGARSEGFRHGLRAPHGRLGGVSGCVGRSSCSLRYRVGAIADDGLGDGRALAVRSGGALEVRACSQYKVQGWLFAGFLDPRFVSGTWHLCDTYVVRAIDGLANAIRTRAHADVSDDIGPEREAARYLGDLALAATEITRSLATTRSALAGTVARETSRLSSEKALLETLLADAPVAVLLCTPDYQLVFYNSQAVSTLEAGGAPGLGRNLFDYLRDGPVRHAYERLGRLDDPEATSDLICTTTASGRLLSGRMRVLARTGSGRLPGFVLTLRDVTAEHATHTAREALLAEIFDRLRGPAADLQAEARMLEQETRSEQAPASAAAVVAAVRTLTGSDRRTRPALRRRRPSGLASAGGGPRRRP